MCFSKTIIFGEGRSALTFEEPTPSGCVTCPDLVQTLMRRRWAPSSPVLGMTLRWHWRCPSAPAASSNSRFSSPVIAHPHSSAPIVEVLTLPDGKHEGINTVHIPGLMNLLTRLDCITNNRPF